MILIFGSVIMFWIVTGCRHIVTESIATRGFQLSGCSTAGIESDVGSAKGVLCLDLRIGQSPAQQLELTVFMGRMMFCNGFPNWVVLSKSGGIEEHAFHIVRLGKIPDGNVGLKGWIVFKHAEKIAMIGDR